MSTAADAAPVERRRSRPVSIPPSIFFHRRRLDYDSISELIPPGSSVLDLGCGGGRCWRGCGARSPAHHGHRTRRAGDRRLRPPRTRRGAGRLEPGPGRLSPTSSSISSSSRRPYRPCWTWRACWPTCCASAGRESSVFPTSAIGSCVSNFTNEGRAPGRALLGFHWYDSPNVRFLTIADFDAFCREKGIMIHQHIALDTIAGVESTTIRTSTPTWRSS